jgi:hypothetical protein
VDHDYNGGNDTFPMDPEYELAGIRDGLFQSNKVKHRPQSPLNANPRLKAEVQKAARMEKNKKKHQPKFVYYRLLQGVKNLFAGVTRMFLFRWKRRSRKALLKTYPPMLPFLVTPTALALDMEYGL